MRALALILALVAQPEKPLAIASGVSDEALADTPYTDTINMWATRVTNQLSLTLAITPGTSTYADIWCQDSEDGTSWAQIPLCDSAIPSTCKPDKRRFTFANYTAASGVYYISTKWAAVKQYVRCAVDDPLDGSGTVVVTGSRSWQ